MLTCDVLREAGSRPGRRSWAALTVLLAVATFAGWQVTRHVRTVHAQPGVPHLMLASPRQFPTAYKGPADAVATMAGNPAALSLATGDVDGDGYGDAAIGYAAPGGGLIALHHGNIEAYAPQSDTTFWATARGEFPSPFRQQAHLVKIPVRPDFLASGDLIGLKGSALAASAQGGNTIVVLSRNDSGALGVQQTLTVPGSITAMEVHHLSQNKFHQLVVGVHGASGSQLLIYNGSPAGLTPAGSFAMAADITSFASGDVDGDGVPDLLAIAGGAVSILHSGSQTLQALATPFTVSRAVVGRFLDDRSPVLQIALLSNDGSLHLMARDGFDSTPYTPQEMTANRLARIAARRSALRTPVQAAQAPASSPVVAWREVESDSAVGVPDSSGKTPLMFRTRMTNNGADDVMFFGTASLTVVSHPTSQPNQAQVQHRSDLGADVVAASAVRLNIDSRPGLVYVASGSTVQTIITPQADQTFNVTSTADALHSGACAAQSGTDCTLREAIVEANALSGVTQINVPNGTYTLSIPRNVLTCSGGSSPAYDATSGTLDVSQSVNLVGGGQATTIIQAGTKSGTGANPDGVDKVFSFNQDITGACSANSSFTNATVAVSNLTIQNGYNRGDYTTNFDGAGGAFDCDTGSSGNASVTLTNVTLNDNNAVPADGGGFASFNHNGGIGSVTVTNSIIENNQAGGRDSLGYGGGAAVEDGANLTMAGTTVAGNTSIQNGGGISDLGSGLDLADVFVNNQVTLEGVTIVNNTAGTVGGGFYSGGGGLTIDQESVISNNTSSQYGGGLYVNIYSNSQFAPYNVTFSNITVVGNQTTAASQSYGGGIYVTGGYQDNAMAFNMSYSRIVNNLSAISSNGSGLAWDQAENSGNPTNLQSIDIAENWWGTNADAITEGLIAFDPDGFNSGTQTRGTITYQPYLQLSMSANPASLTFGDTDSSTVTASFLINSGGGTESVGNLGVLIGVPINFGSPLYGSLSNSQTAIQGTATATTTFTGTHVGNGLVQATVDNQTSSLNIPVNSETTTAASNQTATFSESAQNVTLNAAITAASGDTVQGGTVTFTVFNSSNVQVGSAAVSGTVSGGSASATYSLPASTPTGTYSIHASYSGTNTGAGDFFASSDNTHTLTVNAASTTTTAANQTAGFSASNQSVTLSATVTSAAGTVNEGNVTFTVLNGSTPIGAPATSGTVSGGNASVSYTLPGNTASGTYTIQAVYNGDANLSSSTDTSHTLSILSATTTTAANASATYSANSQSVTLSATVTSTAGTVNSGTVTFSVFNGGTQIGASTAAANVSNGTASASYTLPAATDAATYTIVASYSGSGGFSASSDNTHSLTVSAAGTTTTAANANAVFSSSPQNVTLSATVTSTAGTVNAGTVTFTVLNGSTPVGTATTSAAVSGGSASVNYNLPASTALGTYTIQAVYNGSTDFSGSSDNTHTLSISGPTTTAAANATATYSANSQSVTLSATVTSPAGTVNSGTVTFSVFNGGTQIGSSTSAANVTSGSASANFTLPGGTNAGTYTIAASYTGAGGFNSSSDNTHTLTVSPASTTTTAANQTATFSTNSQSVALSATVTSAGGTVNAGTVTFTVLNGSTPVGTATISGTVSGGSASVNYALPAGTAGGTYTIQAVYSGSTNFAGSSDTTHTLIVSGGPTTTTASNATATYNANNQSVTLTATVTSTGGTVNGGTVTFSVFNGGTQIGSSTAAANVANGSASSSYTLPGGTNAGTYTIVASYTGAGGFNSSSDNTHTLTVGPAGTTTAAANENAAFSSNSQVVALSATVSSTAGTVNAGTVTFTILNGSTPVGSATTSGAVSSGSAGVNYTLPAGTSIGTYTIQAVYNGSTNFAGSSDTSHTLTVFNSATATSAANATTAFSAADQPVTLSAAVTSTSGPVNGGTVTFTILNGSTPIGSPATSGMVMASSASATYTLPGGTPVGVYTIQAVYSGGGGYSGSSDSTHTLTVIQATPVITWSNPADTLFGGALGTGQLNATANTPGTFVYTPPAGTVLPVGNAQMLSTVFTPTDTVDYTSAVASVQINVLPAEGAGLILTEILTRDPNTQNVIVTFTIANSNNVPSTNVVINASSLGSVGTITATPLSMPDVPAGGSSSVALTFPSSVGTSGTQVFFSVNGSSSMGGFSGSTRVVLP